MKSNFDFLEKHFPILARYGQLAEKYLYSDSNSCLMKLGMMGESIINLIYTYDNLPLPLDGTAVAKIDYLFRDGMITRDLSDIFHALRKVRNKAAHEAYASVEDGKTFLQMAHSLAEWFMQTYGDWSYQHTDFVMPSETAKNEPSDKEAEKAEEDELTKKAEEAAKAAAPVDKTARQKKASEAASQRIRTEAETRYLIDEQLRKVGWEADTNELRYSKGTRPTKGRNLAIAEWPTDSTVGNSGRADYALFIGLQLYATIEAKAIHHDIPSVIDYQCKDYSRLIKAEHAQYQTGTWGNYKVPFTFATNGRPYLDQLKTKSGIWFLDLRKASNAPKALRGWYSPEGLENLLADDIDEGNRKLREMSYDLLQDKDGLNLHDYQVKAIKAVETALMNGQQKILLAMATGTGKTRTAIGLIYRFLKAERFHRILFLVDRNALGNQATDSFKDVKLEDLLTLNDIYEINELEDSTPNEETRIQVATVQSMVKRILYNDGENAPAVTDYDLIIIDEAHRGYILDREMSNEELLYRDQLDFQSKYRTVIDYFEGVKIAMTATPALHTTQIFGKPVFTYSYREAVIEGYLVDHDAPHKLTTKLSNKGIHYKVGDQVVIYDPHTHQIINGAEVKDELDFNIEKFNKQIIVPEFNKAVLEEIARDLDPETRESGKTLIYAVDDAHADMIVDILKNYYSQTGVDNDAIMKITGSIAGGNKKKIDEAIAKFKNEQYPSIVVTVDLLTTGIDVPEITTLVFMRCVRSRILFEQMLGRATRLCPDIKKTHFEIYDPVGLFDLLGDVTTMNPVVANPSASFKQLLDGLVLVEEAEAVKCQVDMICAKLQRKKRNMTMKTLEHFSSMTGGMNPTQYIEKVREMAPFEAKKELLDKESLFEFLDNQRPDTNRFLIIDDSEDEVIAHTRGYGKTDKPDDYLDAFAEYVKTNMNEIAALNVVCTRPKDLTRESLKSLRLTLDREGFTTQQLNTAINELTNQEIAADIISLIRRYAIGSALISHEAKIHRATEKLRKAHSFSKQELNWIARIEKYLMEESVLNIDVFDDDSRFKAQGGYSKINKIFGNKLDSIIYELNEYLYDDDGGRTA